MKIIRPITLLDSMLTASNVPETDYAEFAMATTYGVGDYCMVATGLEILALDVAPASDWVAGDILTGQTSSKTCVAVAKITSLTYYVRERSGAFTLGEVIGVTGTPAKLADQGAAHPTITAPTDKIHKIYESLAAGNQGNYPPLDVLATIPKWLEVGPTNRWKAFDVKVGSQTSQADTITYQITPGEVFDSIAFLNLNAVTAQIVLTDPVEGVVYNRIIDLISTAITGSSGIYDWYSYFFSSDLKITDVVKFDLPPYLNAVMDITITHTGDMASIGGIVFGVQATLGATQYSPTIGIRDYSVKVQDDFGIWSVTQRAFSKTMSCDILVESVSIANVQDLLALYRSTLLVWVGAESYPSTIIYGFYKDFSITISYPAFAICSIEVEGLT